MSLPTYLEGLDLSNVDFHNHHSLTKEVVSLNVAFMTLVCLVTALRMSIRLFMIHAAGLDDWLMLLATFFTTLLCTFSLLGAHHGLGTHIYLLSPTLPLFLHKSTLVTQPIYDCYLSYATSITLVKLSLIVSYLRIFPNSSFRRPVLCTAVLVLLLWICSVFVIVFECVPVATAWDWAEKGRCINLLAFFYVSSSINIATDVVLWVAPLPAFWALMMSVRERVMICGLFGFGFFAVIASILRLSQLHGLHSKDVTYTVVPSLNWSVAEVSTAITCACVPSMRPLASRILSRSFKTGFYANEEGKGPKGTVWQGRDVRKDGVELQVGGSLAASLRWHSRKGDETIGDWKELGGMETRLEETVDLKAMLRQDWDVDWTPQSPGGGHAVGIDEKL